MRNDTSFSLRGRPPGPGRRLPLAVRSALGLAWTPPAPRALRAAVAGRIVLVTGASAGIGEATARRVAAAGGTVLLVARTAERLAAVRAEIEADGGAAYDHPADLSDPDAVGALVETLLTAHGHVDVVVNNAGRSIHRSLAASSDRFHDYTRTIDVNYLGPVRLLLGLLPGMRERRRGHLVNVSTVGVDAVPPHWGAYLASKSAFEAWVRAAAPELRADGVHTTSIHFPLVHTAMSAPTAALARIPGMTADEAGDAVCRALAYRPRLLSPWWARAGGVLADAAPTLVDAALTTYARSRPTRPAPTARPGAPTAMPGARAATPGAPSTGAVSAAGSASAAMRRASDAGPGAAGARDAGGA